MGRRSLPKVTSQAALALWLAGTAHAQGTPTLNFYGVPGLIDMPSGEAQPDAEFSSTTSFFGDNFRTTLSFQFSPLISASFRYTGVFGLDYVGFEDYYDRSFDLRFHPLREEPGEWWPAVTIGLQDFAGTGLFSAEYIAATKTFRNDVKVTAGIGWGRLGTYGAFGSPFGSRPPVDVGEGGTLNFDTWFRGPAAPFAGIEWQVNDKLGLKLEYSSDAYTLESENRQVFDRRSPFSFGAEYQVARGVRLGAYAMYGSEIGVNAAFTMNPRRAVTPLAFPAPQPIAPRPGAAASWGTAWTSAPGVQQTLETAVGQRLAAEGLTLESLAVSATQADLRFRDARYDVRPNAIGRAARVLANTLPPSVEVFRLIPVLNGTPTLAVTVRRTDLERLENMPDPASTLWDVTEVTDAGGIAAPPPVPDLYPRLGWSIEPYFRASYFDPRQPLKLEGGIRALGEINISPGITLAGSVRMPVYTQLDDDPRKSNSVLPRVRTNFPKYDTEGQPGIEYLTLNASFRPAENWHGRVTVGYLESMFAGISGEVLWKPVDSRLALGAELNYVQQRDFDMMFALRDYDVITGHASAYYDIGKGYQAQVDVGRYLAGDLGATFALDRRFANGWSVGAFFTLTDVSFEDFGEGSFDKGVRFSLPITWLIGQPTQSSYGLVLRPTQRDGGQRLALRDRLYPKLRGQDVRTYATQWGRFWR